MYKFIDLQCVLVNLTMIMKEITQDDIYFSCILNIVIQTKNCDLTKPLVFKVGKTSNEHKSGDTVDNPFDRT